MDRTSKALTVAQKSRAIGSVVKATSRGSLNPSKKKEKKVSHKGWLLKRGPCHGWEWEKRWCVLSEDEIVIYVDERESPQGRKGEIIISEYTKAIEFRKSDAPGEAAKHVKEKPFGFVVDTEPFGGKNRLGLYYLAADSNDVMNAWIVNIYRASKMLKNVAPSNRTSLAEFVALWDAPLVLVSAPEYGKDKHGNATLSVPALCQSVLNESVARARKTVRQDGTALAVSAVTSLGGWFGGGAAEEPEELSSFPLHKYFNVVNFVGDGFCQSRIRNVDKESGILTGKNDLDVNLEDAFKGQTEWDEATRQLVAIENSFSFCHWRGMVIGSLRQALVATGDKPIPPVDLETETRIGKMSQATAQGLFINDPRKTKDTRMSPNIRTVILVSIDGGAKEELQKVHIPCICHESIDELKKENYPWANDAWTVWCHFPYCEDFLKSLAGYRNLVPDNAEVHKIFEDHANKPITYTVHKQHRQPQAPSLLGDTAIKDILADSAGAMSQMIEGLLTACDSGNLRKVRSILDSKCDVNVRDDAGLTAITVAAGLGLADMVSELIGRRADVNAIDGEGDSVLTVAVGEGKGDVVKLLMAAGADKNVKVAGLWIDQADRNVTLMDVAEHRGFKDIISILKSDTKKAKDTKDKTASAAKEKLAAPEGVAPSSPPSAKASTRQRKTGTPSLADELSAEA